ncbi:MAG: efflux RND transporter permease subunit [Alphaproteobacteria bacterium]|nr:efflux RND transporter permease subunit [Alphaproteobacteria bacterium]MBN2675509.1 efflux RND transporter permease subunit [Alphaproteobacteria bacterium]
MLNFFVRRPITTLMFVLFWVVLGIVSFPKMNIERTPAIDFPMVTATFIYPGATPAEIESQVIKKAEDSISEVAGLKKLTSQAFENGGFVMAEFNLGVNVNDKASEVKAKLDAISSEFPSDLKQPVVEKLNPLQQSVMDIVLQGANPRDMEQYVKDFLSNKMTALPGVASISVFGGEERAVRIFMNPELMASRGVAIMDIVNALGSKNLNIPGGKIESGTNSSNVRFIGEFQSIDDIKNLRITTSEGQNFQLHEIAEVKDAARDIETGARYNGENVVIASIVKASDGNAVKISAALRKSLPAFEADMKSRFPNTEMKIISDSSIAIANETYSTIYGIILGLIFTVIVLLVFTRNWHSTIIAGVVIPASLVAGFFFMDTGGFTINSMTLLAYSSALGTLVSNAIILIESAIQEMNAGKDSKLAAIDGTKKVMVPILAGVGTNVVVFLPLAFMGGIAGQFMMQFGMTVVYVTLLSLLFSFTLTPMMIGLFLRPAKKKVKKIESSKKKEVMPRFRKWFDYQHNHPWRVVGLGVVVLLASTTLLRFVGNEFSSSTDTNEITVTARAPMGSTFEKSESIAKKIENKLHDFKEVKSTSVKIGERGLQNISVKIELVEKSNRKLSDKALAQRILPELAEIPDTEIQIRAGESMQGGAVSSDMVLNINGEDDIKREEYAKQALKLINEIPEVQSAVFAQQEPGQEIRFIPDDKKMNFWGIKNSYAGITLRTALFGNDSYKYKESGKEYPIIFEFAKPFVNQDMFDSVYVNSQKGLVSLSELGTIKNVRATSDIRRLDKNRITEIDINIGKSTIGPVQKNIEEKLATINWENGYGAHFGGMSEIQSETNSEIGTTFLLATILTFMLLAAIMNSLAHPFTIATSIITSFAGVFILLFLSGASINVAALLAIVMLVGLVVNNNILIMEPTINRINKGEKPYNALWAEFVDKKTMILMTSISIMAGMLPQLWSSDGMKTSMAAVMIGGMFASLVWTFVLTPSLFFLMERLRSKVKGKK